ncbi:MAG: DUF2127 domain-containing protein [Elusimicrobiota bacterium]
MELMNRRRALIDNAFRISMWFKALDGCLSVAVGAILILVHRVQMSRWVFLLTREELAEDPADFFATHLRIWAAHFHVDARTTAAVYLIFHGLISAILGVNVLKKHLWAYRWAMALLALFLAYLIERAVRDRSPAIILLCVWDMATLLLLVWEYMMGQGIANGAASRR